MVPLRIPIAINRAFKAAIWLAIFSCLTVTSIRAEWITFGIKLPLPYAAETFFDSMGNSFLLYEEQGEATYSGFGVDTDDPALPLTIFSNEQYAVLDAATLLNAAGGYVRPTFQFQSGFTPTVRILLPSDRPINTLALAQGAINTPLTIYEYVSLSDGQGGTNSFQKAIASYDPSSPFWIVDLWQKKRAPQGAVDVRFVTWETDYTQYPLTSVMLFLEGREGGHKFTVHSWASDGPIITSSVTATAAPSNGAIEGYYGPNWASPGTFNVPENSACLTIAMGHGMSFYITRDADAVSTPQFYLTLDSGLPQYYWSLFGIFPDPPNRPTPLQERSFRVNDGRDGHQFTVLMSDGYSTHFDSNQYAQSTISEWDGQPVTNPLSIITFTAQIDPSKSWWLRDDTTGEEFPIGQTDILNGWVPQYGTSYPFVVVRLPSWGLVTSISIVEPGSTEQIFPSGGYSETTVFPGVDGMVDFTIEGGVVEFQPQTTSGVFLLWGGFDFGPERMVYTGLNDFRLILPPPQLKSLDITTTRWDHELVVRHSEGTSYPIVKHSTQGDVSFDPNQNAWWNSYYYFDATSSYHPEIPWYVEDRTTNERIGPNPTNAALINWLYLAPPDPMDAYAPSSSSILVTWTAVPGSRAIPSGA